MAYMDVLKGDKALAEGLGLPSAHLVWVMGLYLDEPDLEALASAGLTDGPDDKKIDFIHLDRDVGRILFAQGYFAQRDNDSAPANKASDLNTAAAWLVSGDLADIPEQLRAVVSECRDALGDGDIENIELLYVHNLPESVNVTRELQTAANHLRQALGPGTPITVTPREIGRSLIEWLFATQESHIEVRDEILCPSKVQFFADGPMWKAAVLSVPGIWLHSLFAKYKDALFSANYRGFLGATKRRKVNTGIRSSAENSPEDFWVFNNGITLLTLGMDVARDGTKLTGLSIINGAQTTGSIGAVSIERHSLANVNVMCRIIPCSDSEKIAEIVKFNNTQNAITTWDQYANDHDQTRIEQEFTSLGHSYSRKRGFRPPGQLIGIEDVIQPLLALQGRYRDAYRGKNDLFDRRPLYKLAFENKKARHIPFVHTLSRAVDQRRLELKEKSSENRLIEIEKNQLDLLRYLRFKQFFVATVARTLEAITDRPVDPSTIAFSQEASKCAKHSMVDLVAAWGPVVDSILTIVCAHVDKDSISDFINEDEKFDQLAKIVSSIVYASRSSLPVGNFAALLSDT